MQYEILSQTEDQSRETKMCELQWLRYLKQKYHTLLMIYYPLIELMFCGNIKLCNRRRFSKMWWNFAFITIICIKYIIHSVCSTNSTINMKYNTLQIITRINTNIINNSNCIDQSVLAHVHDGSRDDLVLPQQQLNEIFLDDNEEIIAKSTTYIGMEDNLSSISNLALLQPLIAIATENDHINHQYH